MATPGDVFDKFFGDLHTVRPILAEHIAATKSTRAQATLDTINCALDLHGRWKLSAYSMLKSRDHKRVGRALRVHRARMRAKDLQDTRVPRGRLVARCKTPRVATMAAAREQQAEHSHLRTLSTDVFRAMLLDGYLTERCRLCERWTQCKPLFREMRPDHVRRAHAPAAAVCGDCTLRYAVAECSHCAACVFSLDTMLRKTTKIGYVSRPGAGAEWQFFCDDDECSAPPTGSSDDDDSHTYPSDVPPVCDNCGDECDEDDGWHVRSRLHSDDVYCDRCFQRSPYEVCAECNVWIDIDEHGPLHDDPRKAGYNGKICDACEFVAANPE